MDDEFVETVDEEFIQEIQDEEDEEIIRGIQADEEFGSFAQASE